MAEGFMSFQVNGVDIITNPYFYSSSMLGGKTVNGFNPLVWNTGYDCRWIRPRFWNNVGTYGVFVGSATPSNYTANATLGGGSLYYTGSSNLGYSYPCVRSNPNHQSANVSGTWRHTSYRSYSNVSGEKTPGLWVRIS